MRRAFITFAAAMMLFLVGASSALARVVPVTTLPDANVSLDEGFDCSNPPPLGPAGHYASLQPHGVHMDGWNGPLNFSGLVLNNNPANGHRLEEILQLQYDGRAGGAPVTPGGWSFLQVFTNSTSGTHVITFSPNTQPGYDPLMANSFRTWDVVTGTVRFDDPTGFFPSLEAPWATIVAAHPNDIVTGIALYGGTCAGPGDVPLTTWFVEFNNVRVSAVGDDVLFDFGTEAGGTPGPAGPAGRPGVNGPVVTPGVVPGPAGAPGATAPVVTPTVRCAGNTVRTLHAARRSGERFLSARASLLSRNGRGLLRLPVRGRTITLDLRNRPEGNYNVRIRARYESLRTGKVKTRTTTRNFSVACA